MKLTRMQDLIMKLRAYSLEKIIIICFVIGLAFFIGYIFGITWALNKGLILADRYLDIQLNGHAREIYEAYKWKFLTR